MPLSLAPDAKTVCTEVEARLQKCPSTALRSAQDEKFQLLRRKRRNDKKQARFKKAEKAVKVPLQIM